MLFTQNRAVSAASSLASPFPLCLSNHPTFLNPDPAFARFFPARNRVTERFGLPESAFRSADEVEELARANASQYCAGIFLSAERDEEGAFLAPYTQYMDEETECSEDEDIFIGWIFYEPLSAKFDIVDDFLHPLRLWVRACCPAIGDEEIEASTFVKTVGREWRQVSERLTASEEILADLLEQTADLLGKEKTEEGALKSEDFRGLAWSVVHLARALSIEHGLRGFSTRRTEELLGDEP